MARDSEYRELSNKYQLAVAQIRELTDQMAAKGKMWQEYEAKCEIVDKHSRKLCEKILAKDRSEMVLGDAKTWYQYTTDELIQKAMDSFDKYVLERTKLMNDIMTVAEERGRALESLTEQIETMMQSGNVSAPHSAEEMLQQAEKTASEKSALDKVSNKTREAAAAGRIDVVIEEEEDLTNAEIEEYQRLADTAEQIKLTASSVKQVPSNTKLAAKKKAEENAAMAHVVDIKDHIAKCNDSDWALIEVIGKKGLSRYQDIERELMLDSEMLKSAIRSASTKLTSMGAVQKETFTLPVSSKSTFYQLSVIGKRMFKYHFNEEPCLSEIERVVKEHDNAEHGYGIMEACQVLEESGLYDEVSCYNRDKAIEVEVEGQKLKYIPDIICQAHKGYKMYIEYERGTHHQVDFNMKLNKMCKVTRFLYIIAPNVKTLKVLKEKVDIWIRSYISDKPKKMTIRMGTINDLRKESTEYPLEYDLNKGTEPVKTPF